MDFIPLNTSNNSKDNNKAAAKRKPSNMPGPASKKKSQALSQAASSSPNPNANSPASSSRLIDPKLRPRIVSYLERNGDKEYIDIEAMAKELHSRHPEYGRKKLKDFGRQVSQVFDKLISDQTASKNDSDDDDVVEVVSTEEEGIKVEKEEETKVKNSMGATMRSLYSKNPNSSGKSETKVQSDKPGKANTPQQQSAPNGVSNAVTKKTSNIPKTANGGGSSSDTDAATQQTPIPAVSKTPKRALAPKTGSRQSSSTTVGSVSNPSVTFNDVAGCGKAVESLFEALIPLARPCNYISRSYPPPRGCIIHGPPGCGKTLLARAAAGTCKLPAISVSGTEIITGVSGDSESRIRGLFEQARALAPCLIILDKMDVVSKQMDKAEKDMDVRLTSQLISSLDQLNEMAPDEDGGNVFVLGVTSRLEVIDQAVRQRFNREIAMGIPDTAARQEILEMLCKSLQLGKGVNMDRLSKLTPGYVGFDLKLLVDRAFEIADKRDQNALKEKFSEEYDGEEDVDFPYAAFFSFMRDAQTVSPNAFDVTMDDFTEALKSITPSAMKEGFATVPDVTFDDVGALDHIRNELMMAVVEPAMNPGISRQLALDASPQGALLWGPPGCGKTLLAKAVANQAGINFISVRGPELINMYVGESERAVRQVFQRARNSAPCVVFFDEIDSVCPKRSGGGGANGGSWSNRLVNQLLTEMDGVQGREGVYVMGATNRPDMIDEAILRPGRLTNIVYVGLPTPSGRHEILKKQTKNGTRPRLSSNVDLKALAECDKCDGFSGADLANLVNRAALLRFEEAIAAGVKDGETVEVAAAHFEGALTVVGASVSGKQQRRYEFLRKKYARGIVSTLNDVASNEEEEMDLGENANKSQENKEDVPNSDA